MSPHTKLPPLPSQGSEKIKALPLFLSCGLCRWILPKVTRPVRDAAPDGTQSVHKEMPLASIFYWLHEIVLTATTTTNRQNHCKGPTEGSTVLKTMDVRIANDT